MKWLVAIPVWGERHHALFERYVLPATVAAIKRAGCEAEFVVHTDDKDRVWRSLKEHGLDDILMSLPSELNKHRRLGLCNREALAMADDGEVVALYNADMVPSIEVFAAAEERIIHGKRLVMMAGTRTLGGEPPVGATSSNLLRWTMANMHPTIKEGFFGIGRSDVCSCVYFERDGDVALRAFHLQPFAVVKDRPLAFKGETVDDDLIDCYRESEIHVVTDRHEAAFAELSPPELAFNLLDRPMDVRAVADWAKSVRVSERHKFLFRHAIRIVGDGDVGEDATCRAVLDALAMEDA